MTANSQRLSAEASSLANAESVAGPDGDVYCTHKVVFDGAYTVTSVYSPSVGTGTLGDATSPTVQSVSIAFVGQPAEGGKLTVGASGSQSIFDSLYQAVAALQLPDSRQESAQGTTALFVARSNVDHGLSRLVEAQTSSGSRLTEIDAATINDSVRGDAILGEITSVVGGDIASQTEPAGELALRTYGAQAAQRRVPVCHTCRFSTTFGAFPVHQFSRRSGDSVIFSPDQRRRYVARNIQYIGR